MTTLGTEDQVQFELNGNKYSHGYYLADGIYPSWPVLIKTISNPQDAASKYFSHLQEAAQKDIECAFGVLQACWKILTAPCRLWSTHDLRNIMYCCIILHNMIVEERMEDDRILKDYKSKTNISPNRIDSRLEGTAASFIKNNQQLQDRDIHFQLMNDLRVSNWSAHGLRTG